MRLVRFGAPGREKPGLLTREGCLRDLSGLVDDLAGDVLSPAGIARLGAFHPPSLPEVHGQPRFGPPVAGTRNFVCIGLNYRDHAAESGLSLTSEPVVFLKSLNAVAGAHDDVTLPPGSTQTDWEIELAVVIGSLARDVSAAQAMRHVVGYTLCNDVSERRWQLERGGTWSKGKSFDGFGPLGPWLVTKDEVPDPGSIDLAMELDGVVMQRASTRDMIFTVPELISYVSQCITLHPGDIIATGTPPGVGLGRKPPVFLRAGQTMRLRGSGLGEQVQHVVAREAAA